jgi:hypothetical protein
MDESPAWRKLLRSLCRQDCLYDPFSRPYSTRRPVDTFMTMRPIGVDSLRRKPQLWEVEEECGVSVIRSLGEGGPASASVVKEPKASTAV